MLLPLEWQGLSLALAVGVASLVVLRPLAIAKGWFDRPNHRKLHQQPIPLTGGLSILVASAVGLCCSVTSLRSLSWLVIAGVLLFAVAFADDLRPIRARYRFIVQITAAIALVLGDGAIISSLRISPGINLFEAQPIAAVLSVIGIVALINAINMSDGVDGLAGGYVLVALLAIVATCALASGAPDSQDASGAKLAWVSSSLLGATIAYLLFNYPLPGRAAARTFMGDGGSMLLGLALAWLLIVSTQACALAVQSSSPRWQFSAAHALWLVAMPLFDATTCILRRIYEGHTPMTPDRRHIHHLLLELGLKPTLVAPTLNAVAAIFAAAGVLMWYQRVPEHVMLYFLMLLFATYAVATSRAWIALELTPRARMRLPEAAGEESRALH